MAQYHAKVVHRSRCLGIGLPTSNAPNTELFDVDGLSFGVLILSLVRCSEIVESGKDMGIPLLQSLLSALSAERLVVLIGSGPN